LEQDQLCLEIENNYDDKTAFRKGAGMGMYSVRKRLEILFKQYHLFKIEKKNAIFSVRLIIPQK
jgi:LytS/YehU family sensor histidine kinase